MGAAVDEAAGTAVGEAEVVALGAETGGMATEGTVIGLTEDREAVAVYANNDGVEMAAETSPIFGIWIL